MLPYTVAGGKMNRGLTLMSVQQTLAKAKGKTLTPRVRQSTHLVQYYI